MLIKQITVNNFIIMNDLLFCSACIGKPTLCCISLLAKKSQGLKSLYRKEQICHVRLKRFTSIKCFICLVFGGLFLKLPLTFSAALSILFFGTLCHRRIFSRHDSNSDIIIRSLLFLYNR